MICTPHLLLWDDKIEKSEMDGACSTYGERRGVYMVGGKNLRERDEA
jgi:hypothetical protein